MSKEIRARESKKPLTLRHAVGVTAVGVIAAIVAFWVLASIAGIIFFFVKLAVVVVLIGAVFWVISRFRR